MARRSSSDDFLSERQRAEDILLGSLGFGEEARIVDIVATPEGFRGTASWQDGERFEFESEDEELDELQRWALSVLTKPTASTRPPASAKPEKKR